MRIALVTYSTRPRGSVVHTLSLAEALARRGERVTVFAISRGGGLFRTVDAGVRVCEVPLLEAAGADITARVVWSIAALASAIDRDDFDVVHAQDCIAANAVPGCVRTVHHLDDFTTPVLAQCHERAIVEPSAHVCVSRAVAAELHAGWGIEATVIPNGVDAERFALAARSSGGPRERWRAELLGEGERLALAVGGIEPRKGSLDLLDAFALARERRPGLRLAIAGGETLFDYRAYRAAFDARARELAVEPRILGPVDHAQFPFLVAGADVFLMPSKREGFGLAAVEALAAGVPVVLSDTPTFREVFGESVRYGSDAQGIAAAIERALAEPDGVRSALGCELAERLTWDAAAGAHQALYRRVGQAARAA